MFTHGLLFIAILKPASRINRFHSEKNMEKLTLTEEEYTTATPMVYIKQFSHDGNNSYAIHAADGKPLGVFDTYDSAFFAAKMHDLAPVSVH